MAAAIFFLAALHAKAQQAADPGEEILPGSWIYEAFRILAQDNLIPGFEASDFRGDRVFTRSEAAEKIMGAIFDRLTADPNAFSQNNLRLVRELALELDVELLESAEVRMTETMKEEAVVPPRSWIYRELSALAAARLILDVPAFRFEGGASLTRMEIAEIVLNLLRNRELEPQKWSDDNALRLQRLQTEFASEIKWLNRLERLKGGGPAMPPRVGRLKRLAGDFAVSGSTVYRLALESGVKSDISNRTTVKVKGQSVEYTVFGQVDNKGDEGSDVSFDESWKLNVNRHYLTVDRRVVSGMEKGRFIAGDVSNVEMGRGLAVGSANITGLLGLIPITKTSDVEIALGNDSAKDPLALTRWSIHELNNAEAGVLVGRAVTKDHKASTLHGVDLKFKNSFGELAFDYASVHGGGHGLTFSGKKVLADNFLCLFEGRSYRNFFLENNSAPLYSGISGGDDENERGVYFGFEWQANERTTVSLSGDKNYDISEGRRYMDVFSSIRWRGPGDLTADASVEKESSSRQPGKRTAIVGLAKKFSPRLNFSSSYTYDRDIESTTKTWRGRARLAVVPDKLTATFSLANQYAGSERVITPQVQLNSKQGSGSLSLSGSFANNQTNKYSLSLSRRF